VTRDEMADAIAEAYRLLMYAAPDIELVDPTEWMTACDKWLDTFPPSKVKPTVETVAAPVACCEDIGFGMRCRRVKDHAGPHAQNPKVLFGEDPV
jgi:hypothetical protein